MSTPPRDYSADDRPAPADTHQADGAVAIEQPAGRTEQEVWRDSVQRTDEIELLISAAVFFALFKVPGWLLASWESWSVHQSASTLKVGMALMQVGYGVVFVLLTSFFVHLALRAFWIGLIGLRSVFPTGIDWDRLARAAPITTEYQRGITPEIGATIVRVDRAASMIFAAASVLVMMTLLASFFAMIALFMDLRHLAWGSAILLAVFMLPLSVQVILDYGFAARSPAWAAKPWVRRTVTGIAALFSRWLPRGMMLAPMLTLQSRTSQLGFTLVIMAAMFIVVLAFPLHRYVQSIVGNSTAYALIDDAIARYGITQSPSAADRSADSSVPRLDRIQVQGAWVELFVPLQPQRDAGALRTRCADFEKAVPTAGTDHATALELRDCIAGLWRIQLDGNALPADAFELVRKGEQRGLLAMLPTAGLAPGRHQIVAARLPIKVTGEKERKPAPPRSLLFWVQ